MPLVNSFSGVTLNMGGHQRRRLGVELAVRHNKPSKVKVEEAKG